MNAYKILKERNVLLQKKYSELNQKTYENIKLSKLLKRKNRELQSIVDKKIQELERTYKKKMNQKRLIFNKEKLNISENLTGIICHEIKSNLSSVNYLYDNIVKEDTLEKNRANFIFLLNHFEEKIQRDMFIRIINNVEKINNNYKSFDSAIHNTHQIINKSISLCQTILANYSMEGSAKEDILSIVKEYCQKQKINLMKYGIRLDLNIPMKLNGQFNKTHLLLLLTNIVNNSFEALLSSRKKQKKTIHIAVSGLSSSLDNELNIKISNNADKIPGQYLNQIFEPFYTTSAKKLGLGLAFCQRIAKFYEGDIKCISNTNSTTFYINLKVR